MSKSTEQSDQKHPFRLGGIRLLAALVLSFSPLGGGTLHSQTVDTSFNPGVSNNISATIVYSSTIQLDGRIVLGGNYTTISGQSRYGIGRLNPDGTLDAALNPGRTGNVTATALQGDGKIIIAGAFTNLAGLSRTNIGRLNPDGSLDQSFNPVVNGSINCLAMQADGKILVGGSFSFFGSPSITNFGRLYADGTVDTNFSPGGTTINTIALQPDGKILVGGDFTNLAGQSRTNIGRLKADGSSDTNFNSYANSSVYCLALQSDNKILIGGIFTNLDGQNWSQIGRLNSDGTLDTNFNPGANARVVSLALQSDGKILVGGFFTAFGGQTANYLGRLNTNGSLDSSFNIGASNSVYSFAIQQDGEIIVGGIFLSIGGQNIDHIARILPSGSANQSLTFDGSKLNWMRGGNSPEVWRTSFEYTTDGLTWSYLADGSRIQGGWQMTGISLPPNSTIRARGYTTGCYRNGSCYYVESMIGTPGIDVQPYSQTLKAGTTAVISFSGGGSGPLNCQWFKNGIPLGIGHIITSSSSATLVLSNANYYDSANYFAVLSNPYGSVTSSVVTLSVIDPVINSQPVSLQKNSGDSATFTLSAGGAPPLTYQWRKNGLPIVGANQASLTFNNVQVSDAGNYDAIFTSSVGSITSSVAVLTVNMAQSFNPGASNGINALTLQPDGKILLGGNFTNLAGVPRSYLGRLNSDGTLDTNFSATASNYVNCITIQPDGKTLVSGAFAGLAGYVKNTLGRLNQDSSLDTNFATGVGGIGYSIMVQPDGKVIFVINGGNLYRLSTNGATDHSFSGSGYHSPALYSLGIQPDTKILVGGQFTGFGPTLYGHTNIARLLTNGTPDQTFNANVDQLFMVGTVNTLVLQNDGKVLISGTFNNINGQGVTNLTRLNSDGSLDTNFNSYASPNVYSMALQTDGSLIVGGNFTNLARQACKYIGRINPDGSYDPSFLPNCNGQVNGVVLQSDGSILVGGTFTSIGGQTRLNIARLGNPTPATQNLSFDGSTVTWLRGGSSPEVWQTTFEYTTDGLNWTNLGFGSRIAGGWQLSGLSLPPTTTIRARGSEVGGLYNGSGSLVESITGAPWYTNQVTSQTRNLGESVTFSVAPFGGSPFSYQWFRDGVLLTGATQATLTITNLQVLDAGNYSVAIGNSWGNVTSSVTGLIVNQAPVDSFNPPFFGSTVPGYFNSAFSFAVQTDGKVVVQGLSHTTNNNYNYAYYFNRINVNGTKDSGFAPSSLAPNSVNLQTDGKVLTSQALLATDGSFFSSIPVLPTNSAGLILVQPDGKILVCATNLASHSRSYLGRLNSDWALDSSFAPVLQRSPALMALQPDGKILLAGNFSNIWGINRTNIGRLNADGTLDTNFAPSIYPFEFVEGCYIISMAVQPDSKILLSGYFTQMNGVPSPGIVRLNPDGSVDSGFSISQGGSIYCFALQADGKILAGGYFTNISGYARTNLVRLNTNGTVDTNFLTSANDSVLALALQPDGRILVGGKFTTIGGQGRTNIARLLNATPATQDLNYDGSTITWLRGGSSPEVWRTTFEASADGTNWLYLGAGTRVAGGWKLASLHQPINAFFRARGYVVVGNSGITYQGVFSTSWFVEAVLAPPLAISGASYYNDGWFVFLASGPTNQITVIEASTDLQTWVPLQTNVMGNTPILFGDPQAGVISNRFYRLRKGP